MASTKNRKLALNGLLTALALILSYVEGQIPAFFAVPGMKLGLTNIVVLLALYCMGAKSALAVNFVRIVLVSILFGNGVSFWYSLAGGLLSGAVMIALKKCGRFSVLAVSISGGIAHNIGQIAAAMVLLQTAALGWYLLLLWFTGLLSGAVIGVLGGIVSQFGDLTASIFKRKMGIKDYGHLIPGHGGILDRFDSVLFTGPMVYYYIVLIIGYMP